MTPEEVEQKRERIYQVLAKLMTDARCIEVGIQNDNEPDLLEGAIKSLASEDVKIVDETAPVDITELEITASTIPIHVRMYEIMRKQDFQKTYSLIEEKNELATATKGRTTF